MTKLMSFCVCVKNLSQQQICFITKNNKLLKDGVLIFSDIILTDNCKLEKIDEVYKRVNIKYILKQKPKGHASISDGITIDVNEIKGVYGRFQTGVIHTKDFGLKGNLDLDFSSAQFTGYVTNGIEKKNFSFNIYKTGKIRLSGGFLGSKNLKKQPESLRKYIIDTYTQKQGFLYNDISYNNKITTYG